MLLESYIFKFLKSELERDVKMSSIVLCCAILSVYVIQFLMKTLIEIYKLPPGPLGLFPCGLVKFLLEGHEKHETFRDLQKKYGSIFSCRMGTQLHIVISDYKMIRELMNKESLTGRPQSPLLSVLNGTERIFDANKNSISLGIINVDGQLWKDQRRFLHDKLRLFGMNQMTNTKIQKLLVGEVNDLIFNLQGHLNESVDLEEFFGVSVSNVICSLLMSEKFTKDDEKFVKFNRMIQEGMILFGKINIVDYFPIMRYLPNVQSVRNQIKQNRNLMFQYYKEVIAQHRESFDRNNIRDVIDSYLLELQKSKSNEPEMKLFEGVDEDEQIMQIIGDLFSAGMETIRTTLQWLVVYSLRFTTSVIEVQNEIDRVVGRQRMVQTEDIKNLPITESTILEVMRLTSIVPLATTHTPLIDEELNGYKIPAGTHVVPLVSAVHMNPELWDEPSEFRPSRFINAEGKVSKPEFFIPFGVGRRMCLGKTLANMEVFLFYSNLLHRFDLSLPNGSELPRLEGNCGITYYPDKFKVCLKEREAQTITVEEENAPFRSFGR